jgi:glycosyltransferase involved in cell wall biosynthesis
MRIGIVTDAWRPQVNGVVVSLERLTAEFRGLGHDVRIFSPDLFSTVPCPGYAEIRLSIMPGRKLARLIDAYAPDTLHVATEGPLGLAARRYCLARGRPFSTSFHTRFPDYVRARIGLPAAAGYAALRWFHRPSQAVMVSTKSLRRELDQRGFANLRPWSPGVDTELFRPRPKDLFEARRPVFLYVGRIAVEKNIQAFLDLDLPGSKVVVGDGPMLNDLRRRYADVHFVGAKFGEDLARHYAAADVFVFPSRTDTFGLVQLEALACGIPVAAYPVTGPLDVIDGTGVGCLDEDLGRAALAALAISPESCRAFAMKFSWRHCATQFLAHLPVGNQLAASP